MLNIHGLGEINSMWIWYSILLFYTTCANRYTCRPARRIGKDEPLVITHESSLAAVALYERWEWSNQLKVMFIKTKISAGICGSVDQHEKVRDLLKAIDDQFITSDKTLTSTLIMKFSSLRITSVKGVCEYVIKMRYFSST